MCFSSRPGGWSLRTRLTVDGGAAGDEFTKLD